MESTECVRVTVNIRPLITSELFNGCTDCISVAPKKPQVHIGTHNFTYDFVFGNSGYPCMEIYDHCVAPLVDALFKGYNATILAYGQTGSDKTYTMGTNYSGDGTIDLTCTHGDRLMNGVVDRSIDPGSTGIAFVPVFIFKINVECRFRVSFPLNYC